MTREDIQMWSVQAQLPQDYVTGEAMWLDRLERFAKLVRDDYSNKHANLWLDRCHKFMLDEREACAKVCEDECSTLDEMRYGATLAGYIRARGETK